MSSTIKARRLLTAGGAIEFPLVTIEDGQITGIRALTPSEHDATAASNHYPGATLAPAYVDIHIHGCAGHDVMEATPEAIRAIGSFLAAHGVGAYLPTTVTSPGDDTLRALSGLAREIGRSQSPSTPGATALGIHLEGPFLSYAKRGVHRGELLEAPSIARFDQFWQAAEGCIRLMTIAPELPGATELIVHATQLGVRCSLGHSNATASEAAAGFAAGARSATHTFNAMRVLDHRDPGIAGYVLDQHALYAELICDGIHVDPIMVRLYLKAKGEHRILLVTDGISATGMPDGAYMLGEMEVNVHHGRCTAHGVLAGSVLTLDRGVQNFIAFTGSSLDMAASAASRNPSHLLGIDNRWGSLETGRRADLTVLSPAGEVIQTFLNGQPALA